MYNTILGLLDGSKRAERILPHVERWGGQANAIQPYILRVVDARQGLGPEMSLATMESRL